MAQTNPLKFTAGLTLVLAFAGCGGDDEPRVHYTCECVVEEESYLTPGTTKSHTTRVNVCLAEPDTDRAAEVALVQNCSYGDGRIVEGCACGTCEEDGTCGSDDPEAWTEDL